MLLVAEQSVTLKEIFSVINHANWKFSSF